MRRPMDSRLRGNDINCILAVIPAKAGIHTAYPNTNCAGARIGEAEPPEELGASPHTSLDGSTHPRMNTRYDAVIIGGGVTGCATALFLAREPAFDGSILVVERDPTYEHAPSAKATGGFRQQFSTPENIRIGLFGVHFLKHLDEYLSIDGETPDVGFRENGYLLLATEAMLPAMLECNAVQRELGADVHFRDPDELRARFPWLRTDGVAGGFLSDSNEGYIDPYSLLPGLPAQGALARRRIRARRGALGPARRSEGSPG